MMKRYEKYKPSGIEWIGEIPEHWSLVTVGRVTNIGRGRVISSIEIGQNVGEYPVYSSQTEKNGIMGCLNTYDFEGEYVTWTTDGANAGTVFYRKGKFNCTNVCGTIQPKNWEQIDLKFLPYFLNLGTRYSVRLDINPKLMNNMMAKIPFVIPTKDEQTAIANYLDNKTAQIDTLIAKKQKLIELLKEERTAIINQAVTKGIDPKAKLKPNGIEWLGDIPEHWRVVPMTKYLESVIDYRGRTPTKSENGIFLVTARNIKNGKINYELAQEYILEEEYEKTMSRGELKEGDVLFTTEAPLGEVANVDRTDVAVAQRVIKFRGKRNILNNYYLKYWIKSPLFQQDLYSLSTGSTAIGIKASKLFMLKLLLPPFNEQSTVIEYIADKEKQFDATISKIEKEIELMQEYRIALISEVVTGKIKVI